MRILFILIEQAPTTQAPTDTPTQVLTRLASTIIVATSATLAVRNAGQGQSRASQQLPVAWAS